jgi:hypothetical protein
LLLLLLPPCLVLCFLCISTQLLVIAPVWRTFLILLLQIVTAKGGRGLSQEGGGEKCELSKPSRDAEKLLEMAGEECVDGGDGNRKKRD